MGETRHLHLIGGFLGSGKTTAIINAAKILMQRGMKVGVVTNDQGKYLVDTAFFKLSDVPTVEVTGGCFCCNYQDLEEQIRILENQVKPDVIFAESVGSCADLIATVVKPLKQLRQVPHIPTSLTVFTDARLLRLRLLDLPLPFSDNVVYIFDQQIEEADLLIVNKIDLLPPRAQQEVLQRSNDRYPAKKIIGQNSLTPEGVIPWLEALESGEGLQQSSASLSIDYRRYGAGEAQLAWLDETLTFSVPANHARMVLIEAIDSLLDSLKTHHAAIGHMKFLVFSNSNPAAKISVTAPPMSDWAAQLPQLEGDPIHLVVNARVEIEAQTLKQLINACFENALQRHKGHLCIEYTDAFHPKFPQPTYRMNDERNTE